MKCIHCKSTNVIVIGRSPIKEKLDDYGPLVITSYEKLYGCNECECEFAESDYNEA